MHKANENWSLLLVSCLQVCDFEKSFFHCNNHRKLKLNSNHLCALEKTGNQYQTCPHGWVKSDDVIKNSQSHKAPCIYSICLEAFGTEPWHRAKMNRQDYY